MRKHRIRHRNRKTICAECKHRGLTVHLDGKLHPTCLRHRMDGSAQALPQSWIEELASREARCDLYQPAEAA